MPVPPNTPLVTLGIEGQEFGLRIALTGIEIQQRFADFSSLMLAPDQVASSFDVFRNRIRSKLKDSLSQSYILIHTSREGSEKILIEDEDDYDAFVAYTVQNRGSNVLVMQPMATPSNPETVTDTREVQEELPVEPPAKRRKLDIETTVPTPQEESAQADQPPMSPNTTPVAISSASAPVQVREDAIEGEATLPVVSPAHAVLEAMQDAQFDGNTCLICGIPPFHPQFMCQLAKLYSDPDAIEDHIKVKERLEERLEALRNMETTPKIKSYVKFLQNVLKQPSKQSSPVEAASRSASQSLRSTPVTQRPVVPVDHSRPEENALPTPTGQADGPEIQKAPEGGIRQSPLSSPSARLTDPGSDDKIPRLPEPDWDSEPPTEQSTSQPVLPKDTLASTTASETLQTLGNGPNEPSQVEAPGRERSRGLSRNSSASSSRSTSPSSQQPATTLDVTTRPRVDSSSEEDSELEVAQAIDRPPAIRVTSSQTPSTAVAENGKEERNSRQPNATPVATGGDMTSSGDHNKNPTASKPTPSDSTTAVGSTDAMEVDAPGDLVASHSIISSEPKRATPKPKKASKATTKGKRPTGKTLVPNSSADEGSDANAGVTTSQDGVRSSLPSWETLPPVPSSDTQPTITASSQVDEIMEGSPANPLSTKTTASSKRAKKVIPQATSSPVSINLTPTPAGPSSKSKAKAKSDSKQSTPSTPAPTPQPSSSRKRKIDAVYPEADRTPVSLLRARMRSQSVSATPSFSRLSQMTMPLHTENLRGLLSSLQKPKKPALPADESSSSSSEEEEEEGSSDGVPSDRRAGATISSAKSRRKAKT
ncbi:hypothetical protein FRB99_008778 [Tulasnella sp. 403]|nr:hypothetical protein FRB99_008778 [Tulasnella sp. 403]